jgi:hypothetical protein
MILNSIFRCSSLYCTRHKRKLKRVFKVTKKLHFLRCWMFWLLGLTHVRLGELLYLVYKSDQPNQKGWFCLLFVSKSFWTQFDLWSPLLCQISIYFPKISISIYFPKISILISNMVERELCGWNQCRWLTSSWAGPKHVRSRCGLFLTYNYKPQS